MPMDWRSDAELACHAAPIDYNFRSRRRGLRCVPAERRRCARWWRISRRSYRRWFPHGRRPFRVSARPPIHSWRHAPPLARKPHAPRRTEPAGRSRRRQESPPRRLRSLAPVIRFRQWRSPCIRCGRAMARRRGVPLTRPLLRGAHPGKEGRHLGFQIVGASGQLGGPIGDFAHRRGAKCHGLFD